MSDLLIDHCTLPLACPWSRLCNFTRNDCITDLSAIMRMYRCTLYHYEMYHMHTNLVLPYEW